MQKPKSRLFFSCSLHCREEPPISTLREKPQERIITHRNPGLAARCHTTSLTQDRDFIHHSELCPRCPPVGAKHCTRHMLLSDGNVGEPEIVPRLWLEGEREKKKIENKLITHAEQPFLAGSPAMEKLVGVP